MLVGAPGRSALHKRRVLSGAWVWLRSRFLSVLVRVQPLWVTGADPGLIYTTQHEIERRMGEKLKVEALRRGEHQCPQPFSQRLFSKK